MNYDSTFALTAYYDPAAVALPEYHYPYAVEDDSASESYYSAPAVYDLVPPCQRRLADERLKCDKYLGWSIDWATAFLVDHLTSKASDVKAAIRRVHNRVQESAPEESVAYKAFTVLNTALFGGHLSDAVYLSFGRLGSDVSGATYTHGQGPNRRVRRISISLNTDVLDGANVPRLVSSLIHQMIHAYFLVACGQEQEKETAYGRLDHGPAFSKVFNTIKDFSRSNGKACLPGRDHCLRHDRRPIYDGDYYMKPPRRHNSAWYCSNCQLDQAPIAVGDVEKWYGGVSQPLLDLPDSARKLTVFVYNKNGELEEVRRPELPASGDGYQFIFKDKCIQVPGSKVEAYLSVKRAFDRGGSVYMEVDKDITDDGFMAMLEILHTGAYGPDITPLTGGRSGPPIIKPMRSSSPSYLLKDIIVFKTALEMGFDDFLALALDRMRSQTVTHEDPIAVLEAIYAGKDPHPDIRQWAKDFLVKSDMDDGGWPLPHTPDFEAPNLVKLKTEMFLRERFADLCRQCSALYVDVQKAEEALAREGKVSAGHFGPKRGMGLLGGASGYGLSAVHAPAPLGISLGVGVGVPSPPSRGLAYPIVDDYLRYPYLEPVEVARNAAAARMALGIENGWY